MGTDIHFHLEQRQSDGTWFQPNIGDYYELWDNILDRNYNLFACLADVRNYNHLPSMNVYRSIPNDISQECKDDLYEWGYTNYCYWATLKEFYDYYIKQPHSFIQGGILIGQTLKDFKEHNIKPNSWCQGYGGDEEHEYCEWEEHYHPMDNFMVSILTLSYLYYQQIIPLEDIRTSEKIQQFVDKYGNDIRGIFWFDS